MVNRIILDSTKIKLTMMDIMGMVIVIFICLQTAIGQTIPANKIAGERTESEYVALGLLKNTDNFNQFENYDTIIIGYTYFTVTKKVIETSENISIYRNGNPKAIFQNSDYYFYGIKNNRYAIFDQGTTTTRGLMIYDLIAIKELFNIVYHENLFIVNNSIHFKTEVKFENAASIPKCPEEIDKLPNKVFLEEQFIDFQEVKITHTGIYTCSFME